MIRKITYWIFVFVICNMQYAFAQVTSLAPTLVGSTGNYSTASFGSISSSVGEPMVTTVSSGTLTITQGFQQMYSCPTPLSPTISASSNAICLGQSTTLTAGGGTSYIWTPSTGLNNPNISNPIATPPSSGNITYSVTVGTGNCTADTFITITVNALPVVAASVSNPSTGIICPGDTATLMATSSSTLISYLWTPGNITGPTVDVSPVSTTSYTVAVTDTNKCVNVSSTILTVSGIFATATSDKTTICPGFTTHLDVSVSGSTSTVTYLWTPSSLVNNSVAQNPSATLDSTTTFVIVVSNQDGCLDKDTITIFVSRDAECVIYIYNGITPNGDGDNDVWAIDGIESFPKNNVSIFNRWGQKVWEQSGYNNKDVVWKGTNSKGKDLPDGTYFYIVNLYDADGSVLYSASKWVEVTH